MSEEVAQEFVGMASSLDHGPPLLERIFHDPRHSFRCFEHDYPCEFARWNYHPEHEIHLIRRSSGYAFVGDHVGTFEPGNLSFVNTNVPHNWVTKDTGSGVIEGRDLVIQFGPTLLETAGEVFPELRQTLLVPDAFDRSWEFHGQTAQRGAELMEAIDASSGLLKLARFLELVHLLATTKERTALASKRFSPRLDNRETELIHQAVTIVLQTPADEVRMANVARELSMSPTAFSRFFKGCTGHTFVEYLRKLKISEACRLLSDTDKPVTDICFAIGYSNLSNFNRSFLSEKGMTPSRYRKLSRQVGRDTLA